MHRPTISPHRPTGVFLAVLLCCGVFGTALADGGDETLGVVSSVKLPPQAKGKPPSWAGQAYRQGVVSVANPYGAEAGAKMLEQGGNAIDAAVAIAYALNVVEPQSAGIGGGGFMMIHLAKSGETFAIDSREKAPAAATPTMFAGMSFTAASTSGLAVGVPGMVRGTALAVEQLGPAAAGAACSRRRSSSPTTASPPRRATCRSSCSSARRNYPESGRLLLPRRRVARGRPADAGAERAAGRDAAHDRARRPGRLLHPQGGDIATGIVEGQKRVDPADAAAGKPPAA